MAADDKPMAGTVSMLASRFSGMKGSASPIKKESSPATATSDLKAAIAKVIEETKAYGDAKLGELAGLLNEAHGAYHLDEFNGIGKRMQELSRAVGPSHGNEASALLEVIPAFTWKVLPQGQNKAEFVQERKDSTAYYLNRILAAAKVEGKSATWPQAVTGLFDELVKEAKGSAVDVPSAVPAQKQEAKPTSTGATGEVKPSVNLQGNKWIVEKGRSVAEPVIIKPEAISQGVILEDCERVKLHIDGKVTAISISRCKRVTVEVGDIVSNVEIMSTKDSEILLLGRVPTVVIDDAEGIKLVLNETSKDTQILSSKCAEVNLVIAKRLLGESTAEDPEDTTEIAIPFQFKTVLDANGTLRTEPVQHAGA